MATMADATDLNDAEPTEAETPVTEAVQPAQASQPSQASEEPVLANAEPSENLDEFMAGAAEALESGEYGRVTAAYQALDRKGRGAASRTINAAIFDALHKKQMQDAYVWSQISEQIKVKPPRTSRGPADPTTTTVNRLASLYLAYKIGSENLPDGVAGNWKELTSACVNDNLDAVGELLAWRKSDEATRGAEPEVSAVVSRAMRLAFQGTSKRSVSGGYSGPRRSIDRHIAEAFADQPVGAFLSIQEIRNFTSKEYGQDHPSAGSLAGKMQSPTFSVTGIEPGEGGEKGVFGATKVS